MPAIPLVKTVSFENELDTDGHTPMLFRCDDGHQYFCKHRLKYKPEELDYLVYELICSTLLQVLNLRTPPIALVQIQEGSFDKKLLRKNGRFITSDTICFGSQLISNTLLVTTESNNVNFPKLDDKFRRPYDLLKLAIFDLWVDNTDRKDTNYNLLIEETEFGKDWVAIDHAFCFGGEARARIFNENMPILPSEKLITSSYFINYKKQLKKTYACNIVENFLNFDTQLIEKEIDSVFSQIPKVWNIPPNLENRILNLLLCEKRNQSIKTLILQTL